MDEGANSDAHQGMNEVANSDAHQGAGGAPGAQHSHPEIFEEAPSGPDFLCMLGDDLLLGIWPPSRITLGMRVNRWLNSVLRQAPQVIDHLARRRVGTPARLLVLSRLVLRRRNLYHPKAFLSSVVAHTLLFFFLPARASVPSTLWPHPSGMVYPQPARAMTLSCHLCRSLS